MSVYKRFVRFFFSFLKTFILSFAEIQEKALLFLFLRCWWVWEKYNCQTNEVSCAPVNQISVIITYKETDFY